MITAAWLRCRPARPCSHARCRGSGAGRKDGLARRRRRGPWCFGHLSCGRYHEPRPPFCATGAAVNLDTRTVDEEAIRRLPGTRQRAEDALPDAAFGPAHEPVVERLLRPINFARAVGPATAALERMDDPAHHPAIIHTPLAAPVRRQQRRDPSPLRVRKPKEIRHYHRLLAGGSESQ